MSPRHIALLIALAGVALPSAFAAGGDASKLPAPQDCRRTARHDHGAEKGTPTPLSVLCATTPKRTAASTVPKADAKSMGHDHARFHKQM